MTKRSSWKRPASLSKALAASALLASSLHAQVPAAGTDPEAIRHLGERIDSELADSRYNRLDPVEKRTVASLAVNAVMITETPQCADPSAAGAAAETFLFTFGVVGRKTKALQPIFELPASRKTELVDKAMELASQQTPDAELTDSICNGQLLAAASVKPVAERRENARQVLLRGLSAATSDTPLQPSPSSKRPKSPSSQSNSAQPQP